MVIPIGPGDTHKQMEMMQDFGTTVLGGTVTYSLRIAEVCKEIGIDPKSLGLRVGVFGAEHWSNGMRDKIESIFGFEAFDIYGMTEMFGPGIGLDCQSTRASTSGKTISYWRSWTRKATRAKKAGAGRSS